MTRLRSYPGSWLVEPLSNNHARAGFSCGISALDRYLKEQAGQDYRKDCAAPFVLVDSAASSHILGYYTLSSYGMDAGELPPDVVKRLPRYPLIPATLLGRLAVDQGHHGHSIGEFLLLDAMRRAWTQSQHVASAALVVDAIDERAAHFYEHFGFAVFPAARKKLFLPMKTIGELF